MRAIIIAAGEGKRMKDVSSGLPKCMLNINGKTILRQQIDTFKKFGIYDIVVVKGYRKENVNYEDVKYCINNDYLNNNILNSLFFAEDYIEGEVLITYGDILFRSEVVGDLINYRNNFAIVVDTNWESRYVNRQAHPISEAEKVIMDPVKRLIEIGKILKDKGKANGEFIGMMKVSTQGAEIFKNVYHSVKKDFQGKPFQKADTFEGAYLTDMLQELVGRKIEINCASIDGDWLEIDTPEDYLIAQKIFK